MEKNNLNRVVWVVLAVVLGLLTLYWLPEVRIAGWTMRKIDLLADLRRDTVASVEETLLSSDSTLVGAAQPSKKVSSLNIPLLEGSRLTHDRYGNVITLEDSIINAVALQLPQKDGVTSIVDMSGGAQGGMGGLGCMTFNRSNGKKITNFFTKGAAEKMQGMLKKGLKAYFSEAGAPVKTDKELMEQLQIEGNIIPLPVQEPYPSATGLIFTYQQYEIACYAARMPSFTVPYEQVMPYLTNEVKELLKK
jgi:hypothetical protein